MQTFLVITTDKTDRDKVMELLNGELVNESANFVIAKYASEFELYKFLDQFNFDFRIEEYKK